MRRFSLITLISASLLVGCSSKPDVVPEVPPSQLYAEAQTAISQSYWEEATKKLEAIDTRYPFGAYSNQVQLDLIYTYYKKVDLPLSLATINRFMRLHPTDPKMDWVVYMKGLVYMQQGESSLLDFFGIDPSDREPELAKKAYSTFALLLRRYPSSSYTADAKARMAFLKERFSRYELAVTDYYARRGANVAAANRGQALIRDYTDTQAARDVLPIMLQAYEKLHLEKQADHVRTLMNLNAVNKKAN